MENLSKFQRYIAHSIPIKLFTSEGLEFHTTALLNLPLEIRKKSKKSETRVNHCSGTLSYLASQTGWKISLARTRTSAQLNLFYFRKIEISHTEEDDPNKLRSRTSKTVTGMFFKFHLSQ